MIKINLLSEGKRPTAVRKTRAAGPTLPTDLGQILLLAMVLLTVFGCAVYWYLNRQALAEKASEIDIAQAEYDKLEPIIQEVESYKARKADLEHRIDVITELKANQTGPVRVMDEISRAVPELLWLTDLEMNSSRIKLQGRAYNNNAIATFTANLDRVPEFQEPEFRETKLSREDVYDFAIDLSYNLRPAKAADAEDAGAVTAAAATPGSGG
jgi:type IV pilus assembly protein PilN